MIKSNSEIFALPKLIEIPPNNRIKSELTIEKFKSQQKKTDNASDFTTVSSLNSKHEINKKQSKYLLKTHFSRRLCFSNYMPLQIYSNSTLMSNWFEDRLRLEDKIKNLSNNKLIKNKIPIKEKTGSNCFALQIEIDNNIFYLSPHFPNLIDFNFLKKIDTTLNKREISKSFFRFFKVTNGQIEDNLEPINYSEPICILTCDRKYCLTSSNDFLDREKSTGLLNVNFVLIDYRIVENSIWTIEPKESKYDSRIFLEKFNTPVDRNDLVLIKNRSTNKYMCVVLRNLKPQVVLDRLYTRYKQNINWQI